MPDTTEYRDYRNAVEAHADSVIERIRESGNPHRFDIHDAIHEEVDGSWWVIYTHAALAVLLHSNNDDAIFDAFGDDALSGCSSMSEVYTKAAYCALEQDVIEELNRRGDVNDPASFVEDEDEETDG